MPCAMYCSIWLCMRRQKPHSTSVNTVTVYLGFGGENTIRSSSGTESTSSLRIPANAAEPASRRLSMSYRVPCIRYLPSLLTYSTWPPTMTGWKPATGAGWMCSGVRVGSSFFSALVTRAAALPGGAPADWAPGAGAVGAELRRGGRDGGGGAPGGGAGGLAAGGRRGFGAGGEAEGAEQQQGQQEPGGDVHAGTVARGRGRPGVPAPGVQPRGWCWRCSRLSCSRATRV